MVAWRTCDGALGPGIIWRALIAQGPSPANEAGAGVRASTASMNTRVHADWIKAVRLLPLCSAVARVGAGTDTTASARIALKHIRA